MPSKSPKQARLMRAIAHGWTPSRMKNPPAKKVAKEFVTADKRKKKKNAIGGSSACLGTRVKSITIATTQCRSQASGCAANLSPIGRGIATGHSSA